MYLCYVVTRSDTQKLLVSTFGNCAVRIVRRPQFEKLLLLQRAKTVIARRKSISIRPTQPKKAAKIHIRRKTDAPPELGGPSTSNESKRADATSTAAHASTSSNRGKGNDDDESDDGHSKKGSVCFRIKSIHFPWND